MRPFAFAYYLLAPNGAVLIPPMHWFAVKNGLVYLGGLN